MDENAFEIPDFNNRWDKDLKITLFKDKDFPDVLHVFLKGRIDTYNANFFQDRLDRILEYGIVKLIFRCSALEYVSSSGLGAFVSEHQKFAKHKGLFIFTDLRPKVFEIFQILGFHKLFYITNDVVDAGYYIREESKPKKDVFPFTFTCPICEKRLCANKSGNFRCKNCKSIITISEQGEVIL